MNIASSFEPFDRRKVFYDQETWQAMFEEAVKDNPHLADQLAWLLYRVVREMAEGKKGRKRVVNTMKLGGSGCTNIPRPTSFRSRLFCTTSKECWFPRTWPRGSLHAPSNGRRRKQSEET